MGAPEGIYLGAARRSSCGRPAPAEKTNRRTNKKTTRNWRVFGPGRGALLVHATELLALERRIGQVRGGGVPNWPRRPHRIEQRTAFERSWAVLGGAKGLPAADDDRGAAARSGDRRGATLAGGGAHRHRARHRVVSLRPPLAILHQAESTAQGGDCSAAAEDQLDREKRTPRLRRRRRATAAIARGHSSFSSKRSSEGGAQRQPTRAHRRSALSASTRRPPRLAFVCGSRARSTRRKRRTTRRPADAATCPPRSTWQHNAAGRRPASALEAAATVQWSAGLKSASGCGRRWRTSLTATPRRPPRAAFRQLSTVLQGRAISPDARYEPQGKSTRCAAVAAGMRRARGTRGLDAAAYLLRHRRGAHVVCNADHGAGPVPPATAGHRRGSGSSHQPASEHGGVAAAWPPPPPPPPPPPSVQLASRLCASRRPRRARYR